MKGNDSYKLLSDQQLLEFYTSKKDAEILGELLQRYTLLLFGVCMKYLKNEELARDAVQQVFLKAIQELGRYEITWFKTWIYTVAKNHCLMYLRSHSKQVPAELKDYHTGIRLEEEDRLDRQQKEMLMELIESGLQTLNGVQKDCVTLFYLQKKSYQEISGITGHSLLQVKSHIQNGKRNIRIWVEKQTSYREKIAGA